MTLTRPGAIMGTPEYMAPEQAYSADLVDQRSDLYAVGVMLFEMLSGKRPADGDTPQEIAEKTIKKQVLRLGELCPHLPPALVDVVHHAIAASPDDRFPDAGTMQRALQPFTPMTMGAASTVDRSTAASTPFFTVSKTPKIGEHYTSAVAGEGDRRSAVVPTVPPTDGPPIVATQDQKAKTASMPEVAGPPVVSRLPHAGAAPAATLPPGPAPVATHHRPRRRRSSWLWLAPLLVLVGAAAGATWYYYEFLHYDPPPPPQPVRRTTPVASTATPTDALDPAEEDDEAPAIAQPSPQPRPSPRGNAPTPRPADPVPTLPTFQLPTNLPLPTALPTTLPTTLPTSLPTLFPLPSAPAVPEQPAPPPAPTN